MALPEERFIDLLYQLPVSHTGDEATAFIRRRGGSEEQCQRSSANWREGAHCDHYYDAKGFARRAANEVRLRGGTQAEIAAASEAPILEFYPGHLYDQRYMP